MSPLAVLLVAGLVAATSAYDSKYDNVNVDEILNKDRLYKVYIACLLGQGKCPPDGQELKNYLPEAIATDCSKCNEKENEILEKVVRFMLEKKPEDWEKMSDLYDKDQSFIKKYRKKMKEAGRPLPGDQ